MPGMDGFEVCKILKGDEYTKQISIILLTATLSDLGNKIKGLEIGADDYLVQPIDNIELITRVKVMLRIRQLIEKAKESDSLSVTLHDFRAPLNTIIGFSDLLESRGYGPLTAKQEEFISLIHQSAKKLLNIAERLSKKQE
jgi:DNA-binding response OmpR family regulator